MSACLRWLLNSKLEVGEPWESNSALNPEKREGREKEEELCIPFFFLLSLMAFTFLIKVHILNVLVSLHSLCPFLCYGRINSRWPSEQSSCLSRYLFYCALVFEDLMLLFWGCIGAMCCDGILLQSGVWKAFAEGTSVSIRVCKGDQWYAMSGFCGQSHWITNETHSNSPEAGFCAFLDNIHSSNILRSF